MRAQTGSPSSDDPPPDGYDEDEFEAQADQDDLGSVLRAAMGVDEEGVNQERGSGLTVVLG